MFSIGDFVKIESVNIYGVVVGFTNVFDICQETDDMLIVSINDSKESRLFKQDSVEKIDNQ